FRLPWPGGDRGQAVPWECSWELSSQSRFGRARLPPSRIPRDQISGVRRDVMSLEDYRWLVSDAAMPWLARARGELAEARGPTAALVGRLRRDLSAERAHLVVEQCELRARAREKFSRADRMFFTRKG